MADVLVRRLFLDERERSARFQLALLHVRERGDSLSPGRRLELGDGDQFALEMVSQEPPVSD